MSDYYYFVNYNSGYVLDVSEASKHSGAGLIQWHQKGKTDSDNQLWTFNSDLTDGVEFGPIYNKESSLVLSVPKSGAGASGTQLVQEKQSGAEGSSNQLWQMISVSFEGMPATYQESYYMLVNEQTNMVVDVDHESLAESARIIQYPPHPYAVKSKSPFPGDYWLLEPGYPLNQVWGLVPQGGFPPTYGVGVPGEGKSGGVETTKPRS